VHVAVVIGETEITATISDHGRWHERGPQHDGRGYQLMEALMTSVRVERRGHGTTVCLTRELQREPAAMRA
jgi:anti-sigma regulatory factor (Ser/Thr protein kinase)